ncbi:MAG: YihY/virulence factor BrkB family protein [Desulfohalobiaceae bacterium]|nr:YihY/virulence factor BrkB family protein [Desulfohalobiaceae bacterium]
MTVRNILPKWLQNAGRKAWRFSREVYRSFLDDQCFLRASALTYATTLSIVPFLAVAFSISKGFGFQNTEYIRVFLLKATAGRETVVEHIIAYINNTNVGTLGGLGVALLLITVFTLLGNIEQSMNAIWGVERQRTLTRKFSDYLSVTLVCPLLVIAALSFTATLESSDLVQQILSFSVFSYSYLVFLKLLPIVLVTLALFFVYLFIPNTRVSVKNCLLGAFFAGVLWHLTQIAFINYQIGVGKYNAIYGSFAQLPLFLIWLFISWIIILLGAEVGHCLSRNQNQELEDRDGDYCLESRERIALALMIVLTRRFLKGSGVVGHQELIGELRAPASLVRQTLKALIDLGLVVAVCTQEEREKYCLSGMTDQYRVISFLRAFREHRKESAAEPWPDPAGEANVLDRMYEHLAGSELNMPLTELAWATEKRDA